MCSDKLHSTWHGIKQMSKSPIPLHLPGGKIDCPDSESLLQDVGRRSGWPLVREIKTEFLDCAGSFYFVTSKISGMSKSAFIIIQNQNII